MAHHARIDNDVLNFLRRAHRMIDEIQQAPDAEESDATARLHEAQAAELSAQGEETVSALTAFLLSTSCTNNTRQSNSDVDLATRNCVHVGDSLSGQGSDA